MISTFLISCRKEVEAGINETVSADTPVKNTIASESENKVFDFLPSSTTNC